MNLDVCSSRQKSAELEKQKEWVEAKYIIFRQINGKVFCDASG